MSMSSDTSTLLKRYFFLAFAVGYTILFGFTPGITHCFADVEDGRKAANRGDFQRALAEWKPLAERGNAEAQFNLGRLYANGDGVPRNYSIAFRWFEAAGRQGHKRAQDAVARMYQYGDGVPRNAQKSALWKSGKIPPAENNSLASEQQHSPDPARASLQKQTHNDTWNVGTPQPTMTLPPTSLPSSATDISTQAKNNNEFRQEISIPAQATPSAQEPPSVVRRQVIWEIPAQTPLATQTPAAESSKISRAKSAEETAPSLESLDDFTPPSQQDLNSGRTKQGAQPNSGKSGSATIDDIL